MSSCILCLGDSQSSYYNICNICNCKICYDCYNNINTHQLKQCPVCRQSLSYYRIDNCYYNLLNIKRYSFLFYHLFFNIIIPNITFSVYFPHNIDNSFISHKPPFLLLLNYINFVIVPIILYYYRDTNYLFLSYCMINFLFLILLSASINNEQRIILYYTYTISYIYICSLLHFLSLSLSYFIIVFNNYRKHVLRNNPILRLQYTEIVYN
jgi:hypothetical protein